MATPATLRFRARGTALVPNIDLQIARVRGFIGREYVHVKPSDGPEAAALLSGQTLDKEGGRWMFRAVEEPTELPYRHEYVKACKDGDLWPADQDTADACGVEFDETFGDEENDR